MRGRRLAAIAALLALALCAYLSARLLADKGLTWAANVTQVASFFFTVTAALVPSLGTLLGWLRGTPPRSKLTVQEAAERLADTLASQWADEDRVRRTYDPYPLPVRWQQVNGAGGDPPPLEFNDIRAAYEQARRLVILGPAGSGKSVLAIKLVRDLLAARVPGDRIPVLLTATTWTADVSLNDWIAEQLVRSQPGLNVRVRSDAGTVGLARALADGRVIPVIDGLDELPARRRSAVIAEINAHGSDYPVVLTSRPEEYNRAVAARPVSRALVVELQALRVNEVESYLIEATAAPHDRWRTVFGCIAAEPGGVLATVLTNPLMLWLARTVYDAAGTDPGELLDETRFSDGPAVEAHLIGGFVPAVYGGRPRRVPGREFSGRPKQATRWLEFVASGLSKRSDQDIAWWRLSSFEPAGRLVSSAVRAALYAVITWQAVVWSLGRRGYWRDGGYVGHGHLEDLLLAGPLGRAVRPPLNQLLHGWAARASPHIDAALRDIGHFGEFRIVGLAAALGFLGGITAALEGDTPVPPRKLTVTWSVLGALLGPILWIPPLILTVWYLRERHLTLAGFLGTLPGQAALLWVGCTAVSRVVGSLRKPAEVTGAPDPPATLRADRNAYLTGLAILASQAGVIWLWAGGVFAVAQGVAALACLGVVLLLGSSISTQAWPRYLDARLRLAVRGRLPWRTTAFLTDAHRRGVLRQSGPTYQFRHIRLQERLADDYSPWPPWLESTARRTNEKLARLQTSMATAASPSQAQDSPSRPAEPAVFTASGSTPVIVPFWRSLGVPFSLLMAVAFVLTLVVLIVARDSGTMFFLALCDLGILLRIGLLLDRWNALCALPTGGWSLRITPSAIELTRNSRQRRLTAEDVALIGVLAVPGTMFCHVLAARLAAAPVDPGLTSAPVDPGLTPDGWLPLYWEPGYSARIDPALMEAVYRFGGERLDPEILRWLARRQGVVEYAAAGDTGEVAAKFDPNTRIFGGGLAAAILLAALCAALRQPVATGLVSLACLILGAILFAGFRSRRSARAARKLLPQGPWSLRVLADCVEVTRDGETLRISPAEVDRIALRPLGDGSRRLAVQARLRPGSAARGHASDGWLPLYWTTDLSKQVPPDLVAALAGFAGDRLSGGLLSKLGAIRNARPPVYDRAGTRLISP